MFSPLITAAQVVNHYFNFLLQKHFEMKYWCVINFIFRSISYFQLLFLFWIQQNEGRDSNLKKKKKNHLLFSNKFWKLYRAKPTSFGLTLLLFTFFRKRQNVAVHCSSSFFPSRSEFLQSAHQRRFHQSRRRFPPDEMASFIHDSVPFDFCFVVSTKALGIRRRPLVLRLLHLLVRRRSPPTEVTDVFWYW